MVRIARKTQGDLGTYVAKIARDRETGQRVLDAYQLAHSHLRHSGLSTIFEVASEWEDNSFVALMTWIDGSPLGEYAGVMPILAEDLDEESGEKLALRWLRTACEALSVLHDNGLVHGDLSPRNLIVSGSNLVITDYDCVTKIGTAAASPGTFAHLSIFVQRLVQEGHRQMFAWNPMREKTIFQVSAIIEDAETGPLQRTLIEAIMPTGEPSAD